MTISNFFQKGVGYLIRKNIYLDRFLRYRHPKKYWVNRGGEQYFSEQEEVHDRTIRSEFIASEVTKIEFSSFLEVGCGYGKQIKNILKLSNKMICGIDFSRPQLIKAKEYVDDRSVNLFEADGRHIPFLGKSFDVAMSSAVILHHPYEVAQQMIAEMVRVARRYLVHNEDRDITFSRYGYDFGATYKKMGLEVLVEKSMPQAPPECLSQFIVVKLPLDFKVKAVDIPLTKYSKIRSCCG